MKSDMFSRAAQEWISGRKGRCALAGLAAMAAAFVLYAPSIGHDFSLVDDRYFVEDNPLVQGGLTWPGIRSAWTAVHAGYWAPLLWISFMLDMEISGGSPWSFHLANVVLFSLNAGLVFLLIRRWTGRGGLALAAALLWAFHPARVESVAWITERKDVLSGLFFLLGLWFYTASRQASSSPSCIFLSWFCMLLGGMAKQVVLVMPVALVLLDIWPLGRTDWNRFWKDAGRLVAEKWAFWLLGLLLAGMALRAQAGDQALIPVSAGYRLAMIPVHYLFYLVKLVWPAGLAPLQDDLLWSGWKMAAGLGALAGVTALLWKLRVKAPWALWGWMWFVALLLPLSGVVWSGSERVAVRFLYLPQIGLTLAVVLAMDALGRARGSSGGWLRVLLAVVLLFSGIATLRTLSHWRDRDSFGLWIWECHPQQGGACAMGGDTLMAWGEWAEALKAFEQGASVGDKACFLRQGMVWNHLGQMERTAAAWVEFERKWGLPLLGFADWEPAPERELAWSVRGQVLLARGDHAGAIAALKEAVRWEPDPAALVVADYLRACHEAGRPEEGAEAAERLAAAGDVRVRAWRDLFPFYAEMWKRGARGYAYGYLAEYAKRFPGEAVNLNYMAWLLATAMPDGLAHARMEEWPQAAVRWAELALASGDPSLPGVWDVLAAARANAGDSTGAVRAAEKARDLAKEKKDDALATDIEKRILKYRMGLAWRE